MKTDLLLAQYLYQTKTLTLPGIGTFSLDPAVAVSTDPEKQKAPIEGITFINKFSHVLDPELIRFFHVNTGKMMPLAQSDLESYISLGKQFLNIGKPLFIEGIGTLVKMSNGNFDFSPGEFVTQRIEDAREPSRKSEFQETARIQADGDGGRRILLAVIAIGTLVIIGWGAWYLYRQNTRVPAPQESVVVAQPAAPPRDTVKSYAPDSNLLTASRPNIDSPTAGTTFDFVLETSNKARALKRFAQLKSYFIPVKMTTTDSVSYRLFMELPASAADTARIADSLTRLYARRVKVAPHE